MFRSKCHLIVVLCRAQHSVTVESSCAGTISVSCRHLDSDSTVIFPAMNRLAICLPLFAFGSDCPATGQSLLQHGRKQSADFPPAAGKGGSLRASQLEGHEVCNDDSYRSSALEAGYDVNMTRPSSVHALFGPNVGLRNSEFRVHTHLLSSMHTAHHTAYHGFLQPRVVCMCELVADGNSPPGGASLHEP